MSFSLSPEFLVEATYFPYTTFIDYIVCQKQCGGQNLGFLWIWNWVLSFLSIRKTKFLHKMGFYEWCSRWLLWERIQLKLLTFQHNKIIIFSQSFCSHNSNNDVVSNLYQRYLLIIITSIFLLNSYVSWVTIYFFLWVAVVF